MTTRGCLLHDRRLVGERGNAHVVFSAQPHGRGALFDFISLNPSSSSCVLDFENHNMDNKMAPRAKKSVLAFFSSA